MAAVAVTRVSLTVLLSVGRSVDGRLPLCQPSVGKSRACAAEFLRRMSALDAAQRRLDVALGRLETAAAARSAGQTEGAPVDLVRQLDALKSECGELRRALEASRRDNDELRRLADDVAGRLDGTIADLNSLLET
jgi:hypothetical protein